MVLKFGILSERLQPNLENVVCRSTKIVYRRSYNKINVN